VADVTNPAAITYVGDSDFALVDPLAAERGLGNLTPEGNAHQAEFTLDNEYIIAADEDFSPYAITGLNLDDSTEFAMGSGDGTRQLTPGENLQGNVKFVGRGCVGDPAVPGGDGTQIALVERGVCTFTEKVANIETAGGYIGAIVFNRQGSDGCSDLLNMSVEGGIPAFFVNRATGLAMLDWESVYDEADCRAGTDDATPVSIGTIGDVVSISSTFDGWGYVHLYQNGTGKLTELDQYAIPEAHDPSKASGYGDLSVHEVATSHQDASLAYLSYYSGGFRVIRIVDDEIVEVGAYIAGGGNNFWGVEVFSHGDRELVAASDRDSGLWIFEYTGND
jgi:PA domain